MPPAPPTSQRATPNSQRSSTYQLLTGPHPAALAVIHLNGPAVPHFLRTHFTGKPKPAHLSHGHLHASPLPTNNQQPTTNNSSPSSPPINYQLSTINSPPIDDPLVALLSPDSAELSLHGGPEILRQTLRLLQAFGFTPHTAPPTTIEARIAAALPLCRTELATRTLLAQLHNQHLPLSPSQALHHLLRPPTVAIIGLPNVGKSTLANALSKSNASLTADLPGTTRDYVEIEANLAGLIVRLLDTPGQRQTPDPLERAAISLAQPHIDSADLTLLLTDASRPSPPEELALLAAHPTAIHIATRCDLVQTPATTCSPASPERPPSPHLPPRGRSAEGRERVPYGRPLPVSAKTGQGLPTLIAAITAHFGIAPDLDKLHLNF